MLDTCISIDLYQIIKLSSSDVNKFRMKKWGRERLLLWRAFLRFQWFIFLIILF